MADPVVVPVLLGIHVKVEEVVLLVKVTLAVPALVLQHQEHLVQVAVVVPVQPVLVVVIHQEVKVATVFALI